MSEDPRIDEFWNLIHEKEKEGIIDRKEHFEYSRRQLPKSEHLIRFYHWLLSLEVLPYNRSEWDNAIQSITNEYKNYIDSHEEYGISFLNRPFKDETDLEFPKQLQDIDNDMKRTVSSGRATLFQEFCSSELLIHTRRMERILIFFALSEPDLGYIQGLNEIVIPLYSIATYAGNQLNFDIITIEAVTFKMLSKILIRNGLIVIYASIDKPIQIYQYFELINQAIGKQDKDVAAYLKQVGILNPMHYCFSWILTMFSQVLRLEDVICLWDHLLILNENMVYFELMMAAAIVLYKKRDIIGVKADRIIQALHSIKNLPYIPILRIANSLFENMFDEIKH